jgi:pimeloyl-ACP methyl ester carboxylesterase
MPVLTHRGLQLHYLERGVGTPLLLIHGLGSSGADWAFQVAALESRFRVVVPDLPGNGYSEPPPGRYGIADFADALWALLDRLGIESADIVGYSMGGAVAIEMALQRPACVPRLALINSLATYQIDHWRKWLEARASAAVVRVFGMRVAARITAARVFPEPWQHRMRARTADVLGAVPAAAYLSMGRALESWSAVGRLHLLRSQILMIAAEFDYTPLQEKHELAAVLGARLIVVRDSRHGTPFDAIGLTNASLLALLTDQPLPEREHWTRDAHDEQPQWPFAGSLAEEHAAGPLAA